MGHEQHQQVFVGLVLAGEKDTGTTGIGQVDHDLLRIDVVEYLYQLGGAEPDTHRVAGVVAGNAFIGSRREARHTGPKRPDGWDSGRDAPANWPGRRIPRYDAAH